LLVSFLAPGPANEKVSRVAMAFGENAGKIGLVIGFAAVIAETMMLSGAADRIVHALLRLLGAQRASWALMSSGIVRSVPVFFDTVFYLLVPLAKALY
jgi:GntP family gluconate:H+ symporter